MGTGICLGTFGKNGRSLRVTLKRSNTKLSEEMIKKNTRDPDKTIGLTRKDIWGDNDKRSLKFAKEDKKSHPSKFLERS